MKFTEIKEATAVDCEEFAKTLTDLAAEIREGDIDAFERFFVEGGTEEGDAKIFALRTHLILRHTCRLEHQDEEGDTPHEAEPST